MLGIDVSCSLCYHVHTNMSCKTLQWIGGISVLVAVVSASDTFGGQLYFVVFNHDTVFHREMQYMLHFFLMNDIAVCNDT